MIVLKKKIATSLFSLVLALTITSLYAHITYIEVKLPLKGTHPGPVSVWPLPQYWHKSSRVLLVNTGQFNFVSNVKNCSVIDNAINRYRTIVKSVLARPIDMPANGSAEAIQVQASVQNLPVLNSVFVNILGSHSCNYPAPKTDESYTIIVGDLSSTEIRAATIWGGLRALETFSQLVWNYKGHLLLNETEIRDWPRFEYRGMMIDTARHFIPKPVLLANLDAMAYNKLNVFHWHIVDDQSWPMESLVYPALHKKGAYSPRKIYSIADIIEIIEYARMRGIRVIPEIDTPGHTQAMGKAIPGILTTCYGEGPDKPGTANYPKHAENEILNPINDYTYQVVSNIIQEVKQLFPDPYIHLGMDENYYDCWESNPEIKLWMLKNNMPSTKDLESFYITKTIDNVRKLGYNTIVWQDPLDNQAQVPQDTIIEVWKDYPSKPWTEYMNHASEFGNPILLSACWYINYISYGPDWQKYYQCDPHSFTDNPTKKSRVMGGEAAIWTEYVDGGKLLQLAWPRASAIAERLWSSALDTTNIDDARYRLDEHRCKMLERGIPANPILNGYCPFEWYEEGSSLTDGRLRTWPN